MSTALFTMTLSLALGQVPYGYGAVEPSYTIMPSNGPIVGGVGPGGGPGVGPGGGLPGGPVGGPVGGPMAGPPVGGPVGGPMGSGSGMGGPTANREQLFPFDIYETWAHGYFQDMPVYGGYRNFRPYNYKHVLSQSQVAGGWGMSPNMPYSHEYFRRREQASLDRRRATLEDETYRTELARLRAQHEYSQSLAESGQRAASGGYAPSLNEQSRPVDQAGYLPPRGAQSEELQYRIRQQELQLQALQDEYNRTAVPYSTAPSGYNGR